MPHSSPTRQARPRRGPDHELPLDPPLPQITGDTAPLTAGAWSAPRTVGACREGRAPAPHLLRGPPARAPARPARRRPRPLDGTGEGAGAVLPPSSCRAKPAKPPGLAPPPPPGRAPGSTCPPFALGSIDIQDSLGRDAVNHGAPIDCRWVRERWGSTLRGRRRRGPASQGGGGASRASRGGRQREGGRCAQAGGENPRSEPTALQAVQSRSQIIIARARRRAVGDDETNKAESAQRTEHRCDMTVGEKRAR